MMHIHATVQLIQLKPYRLGKVGLKFKNVCTFLTFPDVLTNHHTVSYRFSVCTEECVNFRY